MTDLIAPLLVRVERSYDAIPREAGARAERVGPFELFVREGAGWQFYARPHLGAETVSPTDIRTVLDRQRELGVPEAFEWVHDVTPTLLPAAEAAGLTVEHAPLMVLRPARLPRWSDLAGATATLLDPESPDFRDLWVTSAAVSRIAFGAPGTATGPAGPSARDAARTAPDPAFLAWVAAGLRSGRTVEATTSTPAEGMVARGASQRGDGAVEIVGVATLPSARRRGLAAAVSSLLARHALDVGADLVYLSAASEDVARVYAGIGFERIGTACMAEIEPAP